MFGYWRGLPETDRFFIDVSERGSLAWTPCEDDLSILILGVEPELTRGDAAQRQRQFLESVGQYGEWFDSDWLDPAKQAGPLQVAPETMLRGFFRDATGPGWALVGDAGHFKHPSTAQGISDAIEQSLHVADELTAGEESLDGYAAWRDERAREHYEFSFDFGRLAKPEVSGPVFSGFASDPAAAQDLRDSFSRLTRPHSDVMTRDRLGRWFSRVPAGA